MKYMPDLRTALNLKSTKGLYKRVLLVFIVGVLLFVGYNQITKEQRQARYEREIKQCKRLREARFRYNPSLTNLGFDEDEVASMEARAQSVDKLVAERCAMSRMWTDNGVLKEEASEFEKAREIDQILEEAKAEKIRFCTDSIGRLYGTTDYGLNELYDIKLRDCLGRYGIEY